VKTLLIVVLGATFGAQAVKDIMVILGGLYMAGSLLSSLVAPVLFGIETLRMRVLPRWFGLALVIVPLALLTVQLISSTLASYSPYVEGPFWIAIGYGLWSYGRSVETVRPTQHQPAVVE
jgi:hypothetical protein